MVTRVVNPPSKQRDVVIIGASLAGLFAAAAAAATGARTMIIAATSQDRRHESSLSTQSQSERMVGLWTGRLAQLAAHGTAPLTWPSPACTT